MFSLYNENRYFGLKLLTVIIVFVFLLIPGATKVQAKSLSLNYKTAYMAKKDTLQLKVKGVKASKVKWTTSNKKIATVSKKGLVTAKKTGKATITAKVNNKKLKCKIVVEKKTVNRARRLRDYVLEKGKPGSKSSERVIEKTIIDEDCNSYYMTITASKKNNKLKFTYLHRPDAPDKRRYVEMKIDLIGGKSSVKKGTVKYNYEYADNFEDKIYEGTIVTDSGEEESSCTLTKYAELVNTADPETEAENYEYETYTYCVGMSDELETLAYYVRHAFDKWDEWMTSVKTLKKYDITMEGIGFIN